MRALCATYGISEKTGYKWRRRVYEDGVNGLQDRSSRPLSNSQAWPEAAVQYFLDARRARPTLGPKKLFELARREFPDGRLPSVSTIGQWLRRYGLTQPRKRRRRATPSSRPFAECDRPNAVWCADFKGHFPVARKPAELYELQIKPFEKWRADAELIYPCGYEQRRVQSTGVIRWRGERVFVSSCLREELIGLREVEFEQWHVFFGDYFLQNSTRIESHGGFEDPRPRNEYDQVSPTSSDRL